MTKTIIIDGKETNYTISDKGEVYNTKTKKYLKGTYKRNEYHTVQLTIDKQTKTVMTHRLVAEAFLDNPDHLPAVHHIDGNKHNNVLENLQWVTVEENCLNKFNQQKQRTEIDISNVKWRPLIISEKKYYISNNGSIKKDTGIILSGALRNGYVRYNLQGKLYSAHRLVYETFVRPIPKGMVIDHINGIKDDNRLENLRCISQSENAINAQQNGHKGQHRVAQYDLNNNLIKEYPSFTAAAKEFNVSYAAISSAAKRGGTSCGFKWKEI